MNFGITLKSLMEERGITQSALAEEIGYTQRAVSKWVNLQAEPTEDAIYRISVFFGVTTDYLLGLDEIGEKGISISQSSHISAFSKRLKELRESKNVSQTELAEAIGVGVSTVGMWESTDRVPAAKTLQKLISYFECSLEYLLGNTDFDGKSAMLAISQLSEDECELLELYRSLCSAHPDLVPTFWNVVRGMCNASVKTSLKKKI